MDETSKLVNEMILSNALEISGVDSESGELLYTFTPKIKDLYPELYKEHLNHVNNEIMNLWEKGFLEIDFLEDEPLVSLASKALDPAEYSNLSKDEQWTVEELKRIAKVREV